MIKSNYLFPIPMQTYFQNSPRYYENSSTAGDRETIPSVTHNVRLSAFFAKVITLGKLDQLGLAALT